MNEHDVYEELYKDLFPKDSIPIMGLRVVSYLDKNGDMRFNYKPDGDVLITQFIGTLYWVLDDILQKGKELQGE